MDFQLSAGGWNYGGASLQAALEPICLRDSNKTPSSATKSALRTGQKLATIHCFQKFSIIRMMALRLL